MRRIYLDYNATTPVDPMVIEEMLPYFNEKFGNASSVHQFGQEALSSMDLARQRVATLFHCQTDEIIFTHGGTESDNIALQGIVRSLSNKGNHIITSQIEHPAVLRTCKYLESIGCNITYLPVDQTGLINPDDLKKSINSKTILISIMYSNNEIGTIQPISDIGKIARESGILFHTDAVQATGKLMIPVHQLNIDLLSFSAHKFYGPKGIGGLFIGKGIKPSPLLFGGHHEQGIKPGTESIPNIVGLGKAADIAMQNMQSDKNRITKLVELFYETLQSSIDDIRLNGHSTRRMYNTLNMGVCGIDGASMLLNLDLEGIACSTGSACSEGSTEISHVLKAIKVPDDYAKGSLRFSFGRSNIEDDIHETIAILTKLVQRLRKTGFIAK